MASRPDSVLPAVGPDHVAAPDAVLDPTRGADAEPELDRTRGAAAGLLAPGFVIADFFTREVDATADAEAVAGPAEVEAWLIELQNQLCAGLDAFEARAGSAARVRRDPWQKPADAALQGHGETCVLEGGAVFERGGVARSVVRGAALPPSATKRRPELAGRPFTAMGVSVVLHPANPYAPTSHCNVRLLSVAAGDDGAPGAWWFGGGFDLTPYYGFEADCAHWHGVARDAVGAARYPSFKRACDEYFFLPHRNEPRGIGGVFYDDFAEGGFAEGFALMRRVGAGYWNAVAPIVERRRAAPYGERERSWQLQRRGRYVEFNLVWDRGTHFGLQSGGRSESILVSMPPLASWGYAADPRERYGAASAEARLLDHYLHPRDWLAVGPSDQPENPPTNRERTP